MKLDTFSFWRATHFCLKLARVEATYCALLYQQWPRSRPSALGVRYLINIEVPQAWQCEGIDLRL